jgi:hypothetical protein
MIPLILKISNSALQPFPSIVREFIDIPTLEDLPARTAPSSKTATYSGAETRMTKVESETTDDE